MHKDIAIARFKPVDMLQNLTALKWENAPSMLDQHKE